jgi:hypothetical protein
VRPYTIGFVLLLACTPAAAQPTGEVVLNFPSRWMQAGETTAQHTEFGASASLEHRFRDQRGRVFYDVTMDAFGTDEPLRTWLHNAGATATFGSDTRGVDMGGSFFWRANEGAWTAADFRGVNLLVSGRVKTASAVTLTGTYAFYARGFAEQPALDQIEHLGSARMLANFQTRTTLAAALSLGRKSYDGREITTAYDEVPVASALRGHGVAPNAGLLAPAAAQVSGAPGVRRQFTWAVRVAQSLDDRTGIWIERESRRNGGDLPPAIVWTPPLFYEDGVYDDPYVVEAGTWRAAVKHQFAGGYELSAWGSRSARTYAGLERADILTRASVQGVVPVTSSARAAVDAVLEYSYFRNASSYALESYQASQVSAGLRLAF